MRLTDGGLETSLIFRQGVDLPEFAAFPLVATTSGRRELRRYWAPYLALAQERGAGFVVDTPTWRANAEWGTRLGYDADALRAVNVAATQFTRSLADEFDDAVVNGVVGPRGDGYVVAERMSPDEAQRYHAPQLAALAEAGVEQANPLTLTYPDEAIGIVRAAAAVGLPCLVAFTVETDGRLPDGQSLRAAVEAVDEATDGVAAGFMVNCAHPTHLESAWSDGPWLRRLIGVRANASSMSHEELDAADELDDGDPLDLGRRYRQLRRVLPALQIVGGCCGTDERHVRAIADAALDD